MSVLSYLDDRIVERFGDACSCGNTAFRGFLCYPETAALFPNGGAGQTDLLTLVCRRSDYSPTCGDTVTVDGSTFTVVTRGGLTFKRVDASSCLIYVFLKE